MSAVAVKFVMTDSKDVNIPQMSPLNVSPTRLSGAVGPMAARVGMHAKMPVTYNA